MTGDKYQYLVSSVSQLSGYFTVDTGRWGGQCGGSRGRNKQGVYIYSNDKNFSKWSKNGILCRLLVNPSALNHTLSTHYIVIFEVFCAKGGAYVTLFAVLLGLLYAMWLH